MSAGRSASSANNNLLAFVWPKIELLFNLLHGPCSHNLYCLPVLEEDIRCHMALLAYGKNAGHLDDLTDTRGMQNLGASLRPCFG